MKLRISIVFLAISIFLVFAIFNKNLFNSQNSIQEEQNTHTLTKKNIFDFLKEQNFINYSNQNLKLNQEIIANSDVVNIHFWASWCSPCVNEVPELIEFAKRVTFKNDKNLKVVFITVSLDENQDELFKFIKSFPQFDSDPFIRIWDANKNFSKLVNADRLPMTIILNKTITEPRIVRGVVEWKNIIF